MRLLLVLICFSSFSFFINDEMVDVLCWSEDLILRWVDFQGKAKVSDSNFNAVALTSCRIKTTSFTENGLPNYRVSNLFYKLDSWTLTDSASRLLLSHERLHFDISELTSRKIRKGVDSLRKLKVAGIDKYEKIIKSKLTELDKIQTQYDKETYHGSIDFLQKEWDEKIRKELGLLKWYTTKAGDCKTSE